MAKRRPKKSSDKSTTDGEAALFDPSAEGAETGLTPKASASADEKPSEVGQALVGPEELPAKPASSLDLLVANRRMELAEQAMLDGYAIEVLLSEVADRRNVPSPGQLSPSDLQLLIASGYVTDPNVPAVSFDNPLRKLVGRVRREREWREKSATLTEIEDLVRQCQAASDECKDKIPDLESKIAEAQAEIDRLNDEVRQREAKLAEVKSSRTQLRGLIPDFIRRFIAAKTTGDTQRLKTQIDIVRKQIDFANECDGWSADDWEAVNWFQRNRQTAYESTKWNNGPEFSDLLRQLQDEQADTLPELEREFDDLSQQICKATAASEEIERIWLDRGTAAVVEQYQRPNSGS